MSRYEEDALYEFSDDDSNPQVVSDFKMAKNVCMTFGKYKGKPLREIMKTVKGRSYLKWAKTADRVSTFEATAIDVMLKDYRQRKFERRQGILDGETEI